jgi:hypothetical protein
MSHLLQRFAASSRSDNSAIGFARTGGGYWTEWDRFLTLDGKPAFHIGNICNTCSFFFERLSGATRSVDVDSVATAMAVGLPTLSEGVKEQLVQVLPRGDYIACFIQCTPVLTRPRSPDDYFCREQVELFGLDSFWDLPHDPRTEYYLLGSKLMQPHRTLFEFLVPMFPSRWLKPDVVERYSDALAAGATPTALAVSILDAKSPHDADMEHLCLTHYLLDGHHKVLAASRASRPVRIVSFLARGEGVSTETDQLAVVEALEHGAA